MSEDPTIQKLLARIAALEARQTAPAAQAPQPATVDPRMLATDLVGTLTRAGVPIEYATQVLVAHQLGDQAPPQLRGALAVMSPALSATQAVSSDLQAVRQRLDQIDARDRQNGLRQSFSALTTDKTKYPLLAAAQARSPGLFEAELATHQGDAAALAEALEGRLRALAPALGVTPPASTVNAENAQQVQSTQDKQAQGAVAVTGLDTTPPPMPKKAAGVFTKEDHEAIKARILQKFSPPKE